MDTLPLSLLYTLGADNVQGCATSDRDTLPLFFSLIDYNTRDSHHHAPCTSTRDGDFTEILTTQERKVGVAAHVRLYTCPFIIANQAIKALGTLDQAIKQASRNESRDKAGILAIKTFDRRRRWKYGVHSSDYPL